MPATVAPDAAALAGDDLLLARKAHWAIDKVTGDMAGRFAFNTAISAVMELVNECYRHRESASADALRFATATAASLVFPFAPHTASEVYELIAGARVWDQPWPAADPAMLESDTFELVCQVNGKVRDRVDAPADASRDAARSARPRAAERAGPRRRPRSRQGDRRARQAREPRRALSAALRRRSVTKLS